MRRTNRTEIAILQKRIRGEVDVRGETVTYTLCEFDGRSNAKRTQGDRPWTGISTSISRGTVSPLVLQGTCWRRSSLSAVRKFCGSLSIDAVTGGDTERAESLEEVIERRVRHKSLMEADQGSGKSSSLGVRLFGWSHGALVALLATAKNSCLFP